MGIYDLIRLCSMSIKIDGESVNSDTFGYTLIILTAIAALITLVIPVKDEEGKHKKKRLFVSLLVIVVIMVLISLVFSSCEKRQEQKSQEYVDDYVHNGRMVEFDKDSNMIIIG